MTFRRAVSKEHVQRLLPLWYDWEHRHLGHQQKNHEGIAVFQKMPILTDL